MGLFSRKKKPTSEQVQADQAAAVQAAAAREATAKAAKEAAERSARDEERAREEKALASITAKRTDIDRLQKALNGFEEERRREAGLAIKARNEKKINVAKAHMRNATRLKQKIAHYETRVVANQSQLDALEDASFNVGNVKQMKAFKEDIQSLQQDPDEVNETLQGMREALDDVNTVNLTLEADANLNKGAYDDDIMAGLDELEAEFADDTPVQDIPAVPGEKPTMPTAPVHADPEEEEMRRLEEGI